MAIRRNTSVDFLEVVDHGESKRSDPGAALVAYVLFVFSGACGLAYEVVWTKYLGLFLGNTVLLHTAVLGTFMGGLALGSLLIGRRIGRVAAPLKAYGWLELAIAGYAIVFSSLAGAGQQLVVAAAQTLPAGSGALLAVKVLLASGLLIVPTVLMGATFPLLTAHVERKANIGPSGANWLYVANCIGAVLGTLVTGFVLIPQLGLKGTLLGVAIVNVVIAAVALLIGQRAASESGPERAAFPSVRYNFREKTILVAIGLSGAAAFCYELVWTRLFAVSLGSSTYSFTLMLAAFISGLALGSVAANFLPVRKAPLIWFAGAELFIGLVVALSLPLYPRVPYWCWQWQWLLRPTEDSIWLYHGFQYGLTFAIMALPTFLFGLTFPAAIRAVTAERKDDPIAPHAAAVYGWNTVGTLAGVLLAGCLLIPWLGLQRTLQAGAVLNVGIGVLLLTRGVNLGKSSAKKLLVFAPVVAASLAALVVAPRWPSGALTVGTFRYNAMKPPTWSRYKQIYFARKPLFYREDFGTTVAVLRSANATSATPEISLVVDGKADATSFGDMPTQVLLGQLPLFMKPDAEDVFILGLGSGATVASVLSHPVKHVDCVELSPAVAQAAAYFKEVNGGLQDSRFHLKIDDGKTFLAGSKRKYDVIISEPTNPWISGVGNLFSEESFRSAARALKPGGIAAQWFHAYELNDPLVATIIRTFREVFPHVVIYQGCTTDYILLGSLQPLAPDFAAMEARLNRPEVARNLAQIRITRLSTLLGTQTHTAEAAAALTEGGGVNSDDLPLLEYLAPHALYVRSQARKIADTDCRLRPGSGLLLEAYLARRPIQREDLLALINYFGEPPSDNAVLHFRLVRQYLRAWPRDVAILKRAARLMEANALFEQALGHAQTAAALGDTESGKTAARLQAQLKLQDNLAFAPSAQP